MACYSPIQAYRTGGGLVVLRDNGDVVAELKLPCGFCVGCRLENSRQWAVRCLHESKMHKQNCFITLTYDQEHCPPGLEYEHYQGFMKRLRARHENKEIRFFMCGEYGEQLQRPHYHACLFGHDFADKYYWGKSPSGRDHYRSDELESLWPYGNSDVGELTFASAAYTARYCLKKKGGWNARYYYAGKTPEFTHMSLKPGIGLEYYRKWKSDIYPNDYVVINEKKTKPPKYYDRQLKRTDEASYQKIKIDRIDKGEMNWEDNTPRRLKDREICAKAKIERLKREL